MYTHTHIYIYIYMCVCVCVCVCDQNHLFYILSLIHNNYDAGAASVMCVMSITAKRIFSLVKLHP